MKRWVATGALFLLVMGAVLKVQNDRIWQEKRRWRKRRTRWKPPAFGKESWRRSAALARESGALREWLKELSEAKDGCDGGTVGFAIACLPFPGFQPPRTGQRVFCQYPG